VFKRIGLLIVTNLAIMTVLGIVMSVLQSFGILGPATMGGYGPTLVMAAVIGFGGSFMSLWMSKWMAKQSTGAEVITSPRTPTEAWLLRTVEQHAKQAGIAMPEVAIYDSPDMNAFATGPTRNNALVAVSTGLLRSMDKEQVEAVIGHEVSHVANGDMVTLTLIQGVVNTFVFFLARVIGNLVDSFLRSRSDDDDRGGVGIGYYVTVMVAQLVLGILASMIVAWFSRRREYRADAGGASLAGKSAMIGALQRLNAGHSADLPQSMTALGINGKGLLSLFSTHPPIEKRIAALRASNPARAAA
jgi:heat shock protein HtpX